MDGGAGGCEATQVSVGSLSGHFMEINAVVC